MGQRLLPGWKFPFLPGSSQDRCVSLSSAILMSVNHAALRSLNSGGLAATIWPCSRPFVFPLMMRQLAFDPQLDWLRLPAGQVATEQLLGKLKLTHSERVAL